MIRSITGKIQATDARSLVITTASGLGYLVHVPSRTTAQPLDTISLHTYLAVRETSLDLYGFMTMTELTWFELLLTIPKIGPKSALQIIEAASPELLFTTISQRDAGQLAKLSGLGKKTAEKIVVTLQDKLPASLAVTHATTHNPVFQDAFDTLITLGYNPNEIRVVLDDLSDYQSTSDLVTQALKRLSK
jgi:Holliday junction DNA helicase RuvA